VVNLPDSTSEERVFKARWPVHARYKPNFRSWHEADLRLAAPEGRFTAALPTLGAECLVSGGKPTVFQRALKVG
jgi:hypothetical protein